jgi:predicted transposase YbfD/YdcC
MNSNIGDSQWEIGSLYHQLQQLADQRHARGRRYSLAAGLVLVALCKLCGEDETEGVAQWVALRQAALRQALDWQHPRFPHASTYGILAKAVDVEAFEQVVNQFLQQQVTPEEGYGVDGKNLRGSIAEGETRGQHLLALYAVDSGVKVAQTNVSVKENELSVAPALLASVDLTGWVVTGDAMFAQHCLSQQITQAGGDYVWIVKDNQAQLRQAIALLFTPERCLPAHSPLHTDFEVAQTVEKGHGRLERRPLTTSSLLNTYWEWEGLQQVFKIERHTRLVKSQRVRQQGEYGITSLARTQAAAPRLLRLVRQHWHIENGSHHVRDVSLREDGCRVRNGQVQHVLAVVNNLVLGLARRQGFRYLPDARRFYAAHPLTALALFLKNATLQ